jgi:predicted Ser/Thr protein kinase
VHLDELFLASTNETYLEAFKKAPDWNSFKGRIELVPVPYLRRFSDEVAIYTHVTPSRFEKPLAPHVVETAALWAVLTRLKKPEKGFYPATMKGLVDRLTPLEKLKLYDTAEIPEWCSAQEAKELRRAIPLLLEDSKSSTEYEGHQGASAREIRTLILNAAHHSAYRTLNPLPVFEELRELVSDPSVYDFLQMQAQDGFQDHEGFLDTVKVWWLEILDSEVRTSMGLVEEKRYEELLERYVLHVSHYLKKEQLLDKITKRYVNADEEFMQEVESHIMAEGEDREDFRKAVIGQIGAWGLEHAGETPDYRQLFRHYVEKMESDYYTDRRKMIAKNIVATLKHLGDEQDLTEEERTVATTTTKNMRERFGYPDPCTAECLAFLLKERYSED